MIMLQSRLVLKYKNYATVLQLLFHESIPTYIFMQINQIIMLKTCSVVYYTVNGFASHEEILKDAMHDLILRDHQLCCK